MYARARLGMRGSRARLANSSPHARPTYAAPCSLIAVAEMSLPKQVAGAVIVLYERGVLARRKKNKREKCGRRSGYQEDRVTHIQTCGTLLERIAPKTI
ncbi:hypothetical protein PR048_007824 [Dryococelus australis]|uniref:Uncharacterized protein n=1 Tax=Dryococelus australis TaxID=614101 RepID=A0ABQ9HVQ7_9NEOP|nr:hypothetical protein PR048_007824 [Dryococelus australis]